MRILLEYLDIVRIPAEILSEVPVRCLPVLLLIGGLTGSEVLLGEDASAELAAISSTLTLIFPHLSYLDIAVLPLKYFALMVCPLYYCGSLGEPVPLVWQAMLRRPAGFGSGLIRTEPPWPGRLHTRGAPGIQRFPQTGGINRLR